MSSTARQRVHEILQDSDGIEFSGAELERFSRPSVYVLIRDHTPLYVGMSGRGLSRCLDKNHQALQEIEPGDRLQVWSVKDVATAHELEALLVQRLRPARNRRLVHIPGLASLLGVTEQRAGALVKALT
jgi:hypothetical protein